MCACPVAPYLSFLALSTCVKKNQELLYDEATLNIGNTIKTKMAVHSDAAATPGSKNCVFMSVSLVSSSSNCLTLSQNHQTNTRKHIYDRQSLLEIGSVYKHQLSPVTTEKLQGLCLLLKPNPETAASPTDATRTKRQRWRCERGQKCGKRGGI